jgi:hypothetical protein
VDDIADPPLLYSAPVYDNPAYDNPAYDNPAYDNVDPGASRAQRQRVGVVVSLRGVQQR